MDGTIPLEPRKRPTQTRSRATFDALVEATARVLVEDGFDKASTNRIAGVAGVSVGSLYQYFPNKEALVVAVVERHLERVTGLMERLSRQLGEAPIEEAVHSTIDALVAVHEIDPELHEVLQQQAHHLALPRLRRLRSGVTGILARWLASRGDLDLADPEAAAFVLTVTVRSVTHESLADPEADREAILASLTEMLVRYLRASSG